ncbi:MAG: Do family serine endopeptidase [Bacteroidales bacterium]|nr:MAG: Do family serine endopeptidase [Bacteroidales bacterium]
MKGKKILGTFMVAILGGIIAIFAYSLMLDRPEEPALAERDDSQLVRFANLPADFNAEQFDFTFAAENTVHGVVHVKTVTERDNNYRNPLYEFFYGDRYRRDPEPLLGYGSGVIISEDGYIVTNNHVIEGSDEIEVTLNDKRLFKAELIGRDPSTDIAVIRIKAKNLPYLKYGDSDELRLGQWVLAVGNPFNLTSTVTAGIISAKGRNLGLLPDQFRIESFIQTDAALNRGNSGGALVSTEGDFVGLTTAIISPTGGYAGNSFAIPVNIVKKVVDDLLEFGEVQRAILGVTIQDVDAELAENENLDKIEGVYINGVREEGAAREAGIKTGDIILSVNNVKVNSVAELQEQISRYRPKDKVQVVIKRDNKEKPFEVILRNTEGSTEIVRSDDLVMGAKFGELSERDRNRYNISNGVKITDVGDGYLNDIGLKTGSVITEINGQTVHRVGDVRDILGGGRTLYSMQGFRPDGTYFSYEFRR